MLKLVNITKQYTLGGNTIDALRGVDLEFRENEFVSILGPSGCGKTTTLNIIGGLDRYTSGDLIINGRSTKDYRDGDWDAYRNHSIGFVFQSYNLISHQSVLSNVELALTLAGVSKKERRRRAVEALEKVGLGDQLNKVPSQMSGGQMQRVAIARALVNDPDILLADEPTGALDSETSVQVMDLLAEIAREKLVIMVTHNPELAEKYANRTIRLLDGRVVDDSAPYDGVQEKVWNPQMIASFRYLGANMAMTRDTYEKMGFTGDTNCDIWIDCAPADAAAVREALERLAEGAEHIRIDSYQDQLAIAKLSTRVTKLPVYLICVIVAFISFMNMANTMITSIVTRKQEFGVLQAVGMTNRQLDQSLQLERILLSAGTAAVSLVAGIPLGYALFRYCKSNSFAGLGIYHFPVREVLFLLLFMGVLQTVLSFVLSRNVKRESLVERIRYHG